jgi:hypothetical protein
VWNPLVDVFTVAKDEVLPVLLEKLEAIGAWFSDSDNTGIPDTAAAGVNALESSIDLLATTAEEALPRVTDAFDVMTDWIAGPAGLTFRYNMFLIQIAFTLIGLAANLLKIVIEGLFDTFDSVMFKITEAVTGAQLALEKVFGLIGDAVTGTIDRIIDLIDELKEAIAWLLEFLGISDLAAQVGNAQPSGTGFFLGDPIPKDGGTPVPPPSGTGGVYDTGGGAGTGFNPGFASGIRDFAGGFAMVGERGPELMYLPPHSNIYPHGTGPEMAGAPGSLTLQFGDINIQTGNDVSASAAKRFALMLHDEIAQTMQEQSARFGTRPRVSLG